jgi:ribosomal protein L7Ae-like RNA K-turn-binding protein
MTKLMQTDLLNAPFFVGLKQSTDAIKNGKAAKADDHVRLPFVALCSEHGVPVEFCETKAKLGKDFGINVSAACAVLLK